MDFTPLQRVASGISRFPSSLATLKIRDITLSNRLFFPAMGVDLANHDGTFSDALREFLNGMVAGGCGLIILSNASVSRDSILQPKGLKMFLPKHAEALKAFIRESQSQGVVVGIQLQHYGGQGTTTYTRGQALLTPSGIGASSLQKLDPKYRTREMTQADIDLVTEQFVASAKLCSDAGAKIIQLQASNGYLLGSFLSGYSNRRRDAYGGSCIARARMLIDVVTSIRKAIGEDIVLGLRIGIDDFMDEEGQLPEDLKDVMPMLEDSGADMFEASFGVADTFKVLSDRSPKMIGYIYGQVKKLKGYSNVPVGFAGFVDGLPSAEKIISDGIADMVGMARALFADNDLILKSVEGRESEIYRCLWDGKCFKDKYNPRFDRVYCCVNPKYKRPE
ncbi:MAG: NADH:flavin oxidoreductase [Deltaproteobacteria bacterium]|nr:NADH:flavin oxidoreductase [Deltaproteobacteria bacterium]